MAENCLGILTDSVPNRAMMRPSTTKHPPFRQELPDDINFPVGVEVAHEDLGDLTTAPSASSSSPVFHRRLMYKPVSARSFVAHVKYDASAASIAAAVGAHVQDVENLWLAGIRTPAKVPVDRRALFTKSAHMRFTPQSVLDAEEACKENGLDREQFADLFDDDNQVDEESLEFVNALIEKLEALASPEESEGLASPEKSEALEGPYRAVPRHQLATRRRITSSHRSRSDETKSSQIQESGRQSSDADRRCGFSNKGSHVDLDVRSDGFGICKKGNGLYRTARGISEMRPPTASEERVNFYFEVVIVEDKDSGGICIGVSTESLALNKLVGSNSESCGLHSSGQLVARNGEFGEFGTSFKKGDRVGCLVTLSGSSGGFEEARNAPQCENGCYSGSALKKRLDEEVQLKFYVNGEHQGSVREALLHNVADDKRRLCAVVSLYKKDSKAVMRCCAKDWVMNRDELPNGVKAICGNHP